jgi:23S rRNA (adenine-N6)-dimethyltransferase
MGFHELDRRWAERLVAMAGVEPGDLVLDVGAGTGAITAALLGAGAVVVAVELDRRRADILRGRFGDERVRVVRADVADLRLPRRPFSVVANPPFAITSALLRRLTSPHSLLRRGAVVLPTWAVVRWAAGRGVGGTTTTRAFAFASGPCVPRSALHPPPPARPACCSSAGGGDRSARGQSEKAFAQFCTE